MSHHILNPPPRNGIMFWDKTEFFDTRFLSYSSIMLCIRGISGKDQWFLFLLIISEHWHRHWTQTNTTVTNTKAKVQFLLIMDWNHGLGKYMYLLTLQYRIKKSTEAPSLPCSAAEKQNSTSGFKTVLDWIFYTFYRMLHVSFNAATFLHWERTYVAISSFFRDLINPL